MQADKLWTIAKTSESPAGQKACPPTDLMATAASMMGELTSVPIHCYGIFFDRRIEQGRAEESALMQRVLRRRSMYAATVESYTPEERAIVEAMTRAAHSPHTDHCVDIARTLPEQTGVSTTAVRHALQNGMHVACMHDRRELAEALLAHGASTDDASPDDERSRGPLHVVATGNACCVARLLLERKADQTVRALDGYRPLELAIVVNAAEMVALFLNAGSEVNCESRCFDGCSTLHLACTPKANGQAGESFRSRNAQIVKLLLRHGAHVNQTTVRCPPTVHSDRPPRAHAQALRRPHTRLTRCTW